MNSGRSLSYRRDIDGLRAIAVLMVVFYHARIPGFSGGFVGVDMFFVISGYVITRSIEVQRLIGGFSLRGFFARRIRRLFPALVTMLIAVTLVVNFLSDQQTQAEFARSLMASLLSYANFHFYWETEYFAAGASELPLLHIWSLGVEEQFYLVWPISLLLLGYVASRNHRLAVIGIVALLSFALSIWLQPVRASAAFYLLPPRAWELLVGCLVALSPLRIENSALRATLGWAGLALVIASLAIIGPGSQFPGWPVLLPVAATALLIVSGGRDTASPGPIAESMLSWTPLVRIGLVSYGFYLWHYPLLVIGDWFVPTGMSMTMRAALIGLALGVAFLSYRYIERPIRGYRPAGETDYRAFAILVSGLVGVAAIQAIVGMIAAPPQQGSAVEVAMTDVRLQNERAHGCHFSAIPELLPSCTHDNRANSVSRGDGYVLLWGDSHADALAHPLADMMAARGMALRHLTFSGCPPTLDIDVWNNRNGLNLGCRAFNALVLRDALADPAVRGVILDARWALYGSGQPLLSDPYEQIKLSGFPEKTELGQVAAGLNATLAAIRSRRGRDFPVMIVGPSPEPGFSVPKCVARLARIGVADDRCGKVVAGRVIDRDADTIAMLRKAAARYDTAFLDALAIFCTASACRFIEGDRTILFRDGDHLSTAGAYELARDISRRYRELDRRMIGQLQATR